jgi:hypothetical protein
LASVSERNRGRELRLDGKRGAVCQTVQHLGLGEEGLRRKDAVVAVSMKLHSDIRSEKCLSEGSGKPNVTSRPLQASKMCAWRRSRSVRCDKGEKGGKTAATVVHVVRA